MLRRLLAPLTLACALAACSDRSATPDADLERDLQLANQTPANPQFQDVPLGTTPEQPRPTGTKNPQPARATTGAAPRRRAPVVEPRRAPAPPPVAVEEREPVTESPAPARAHRGIGAGTSFGLVTRSQVCTSNLPGDKIVAVTTSAVQGDDGAVIPEGTSVVLEVTSVTPGDKPEDAQIGFRVRSIFIDGESRSVDATVVPTSGLERGPATGTSDKKKVIGGAIAGAVIGQVLGRDTRSTVIGAAAGGAAGAAAAAATRKYHACLPAGGSLRVTTTQPIVLD